MLQVAALLAELIVVGHALHNDFKALGLQHPRAQQRDTACYPPYRKGLGNKLMQCLPLRFLSLRRSTVGLLAMRLWVLDSSLKYDVQEEKKKDKKPKKKAPEQNIYETKYNRSYFVPDEDDIDF